MSFPLLAPLKVFFPFFFFFVIKKVVVQFKGRYIDYTKSSTVHSGGNSTMLFI